MVFLGVCISTEDFAADKKLATDKVQKTETLSRKGRMLEIHEAKNHATTIYYVV